MSVAVALLLAAKLTPGIVAMSVESPSADRVPILRAALTQDDAPVRAAAARIVAATDTRELLEDVRAALAKETNPEAAREEIRAIGMSGGVKEADALLAASKRFDSKLDGVVWESVARGGGPEAIGPMLAAKDVRYAEYALWRHPELAFATSSRILGQADKAMWRAWIHDIEGADLALDPRIAAAALTHPNAEIATDTAWYLLRQFPPAPPDSKVYLDALEHSSAAAFPRELLGRALGNPPHENDEWTKAIAAKPSGYYGVLEVLTPAELKAGGFEPPKKASGRAHSPDDERPPFAVMEDLPKGVTEEVMAAQRCDGTWVGVGAAQADRAGRIRATDLSKLYTSDGCRRALNVLVLSSFATDVRITGDLTANSLLFVHGGAVGNCLDESDVAEQASATRMAVDGAVVAPKKVRSVNPIYPESARLSRESGIVILQTHINARGCVTGLRIIKPLSPLLNTSALMAVSQWRFSPGTLDGHPVDVLYNLTINFKLGM